MVLTPGWNGEFIGSAIYYGILPALTIVLASVGGWLLGMRNMMVSTLSEDYVLTAEAKGLTDEPGHAPYAARNAVLPSVAGFAISLGFVVSGSVVTEQVFSYPGIGASCSGRCRTTTTRSCRGLPVHHPRRARRQPGRRPALRPDRPAHPRPD